MTPPRTFFRRLWYLMPGHRGVIDLASVMVGVIILGIASVVISATIVSVIPWSKVTSAKANLATVQTAENAARIATGSYLTVPELQQQGFMAKPNTANTAGGVIAGGRGLSILPRTVNVRAAIPEAGAPLASVGNAGTCYVAAVRASDGLVYWLSSTDGTVKITDPKNPAPDTTSCAAFPPVANFPGPPVKLSYPNQTFDLTAAGTSLSPTVTGGNGSQIAFSCTIGGVTCSSSNLPTGVTFDPNTGRFNGPSNWPLSATSLAGTNNTMCASFADGTARCWGDSSFGTVGDGGSATGAARQFNSPTSVLTAITPTSVPLTGVKKVSASVGGTSGNYVCALLGDGTVDCWGYNTYRALGDGTTNSRSLAAPVSGLTNAVDLAAGGDHACALITGGSIKCWGYNVGGALGDGTTTARAAATPVLNPQGLVFAKIAASTGNTCAVTTAGALYCWGSGSTYLNGDGSGSNALQLQTTTVPTITSGVADISMAGTSACAVMTTGSMKCWGDNTYSQVTAGGGVIKTPTDTPQAGTSVAKAVVGTTTVCAISTTRALTCWGGGSGGQYGDGTTSATASTTPHTPSGFTSGVSLGAMTSNVVCAISSGNAQCWGSPSKGEIGDGTATTGARKTPGQVQGITGVAGFPFAPKVTATDGATSDTQTLNIALV